MINFFLILRPRYFKTFFSWSKSDNTFFIWNFIASKWFDHVCCVWFQVYREVNAYRRDRCIIWNSRQRSDQVCVSQRLEHRANYRALTCDCLHHFFFLIIFFNNNRCCRAYFAPPSFIDVYRAALWRTEFQFRYTQYYQFGFSLD